MDLDDQQLKRKALLLLQRERELFELRMKHERLGIWLQLAQSLPRMFADPRASLGEVYAKLRKTLLETLKLRRVTFFEIDGISLRPLEPAGAVRPLSQESLLTLQTEPFGIVNDPDRPGDAALADALGLARFIWSRIEVGGRPPVILAAGYDRAKAKFYPAFDASEASNLRNAAQHIEGLMGNATLVAQLQQERDHLKHANELTEAQDAELRTMAGELRVANETLEQRVVERTMQLERRNRDMRLVLDNVLMALVTIDPAGRLAQERSANIDQWFGSYKGNPLLVDYIAAFDPAFAEWFRLGHEALVEHFLPLELCLEQLPKQLCSKQRTYRWSYRPINAVGNEISLLIMIEDVTEQQRLEQEQAEQGELLAVCEWLTRDRAGFLVFFEEADHLVHEITSGTADQVVRRRHLHTLKGSAAMMGVKVVAEICHLVEELGFDSASIGPAMRHLQERWSAIRQTMESVLGGRGNTMVEVPTVALKQLCEEIDRGLSRREIQQRLTLFTFEPVDRPLARLARHAKALADRLGKPSLGVVIETDSACMDPRQLGNLWTAMVHLVRNAVDHGIEPPNERLARGKAPEGRMILRSEHTSCELTIEINDDGRGIDWQHVADLAKACGLPHASEADLVGALLSDGFSTRSTASMTSGRGTGLSAVNQEVAKLRGTLSVRSRTGFGTCWRIALPCGPSL